MGSGFKILTWNCNGALRKKYESITKFDADIYVIQECEDPNYVKDKGYEDFANNHLWHGDTKYKGIGIFAKANLTLNKLDWEDIYQDHIVKHFLPCSIDNKFNLLAVWTHRNNSPNFGYIGQLWKYIQINKSKMKNTFIVGDLNSNVIWDEWDRWWNHSDVVKELESLGIESVYHKWTSEEQGKETQPTFYLHRNLNKSYHIDYCFAPRQANEKLSKVTIEKFENWKHISDHSPILIEYID
jgi:exonuclease III